MKWSQLRFWKSYRWAEGGLEFDLNKPSTLPSRDQWFKAFDLTPFDEVKVVILGQDPYPTKGHAHGLAFSVQPHVKPLPYSLRNILREYQESLGCLPPRSGSLLSWAEHGVLLLNTILTVEEGKSLSHQGLGWENLTYEALRTLSDKKTNLVFMLWGKKAQEYKALIDHDKHLVLCAPHPSPLSQRSMTKGFLGCKHFSKANAYLKENGLEPVDWKLP